MTASDVREKDREAMNAFVESDLFDELACQNMFVTLTKQAFLAGIQHARSEQAQLVEALEYYKNAQRAVWCSDSSERELMDDGMRAREALAGWRKK